MENEPSRGRPRELTLGATSVTVGENIRRLRLARGLKISDLADRLGRAGRPTNTASVSRMETGARRIDVDDLMALARVLDVSPLTLLLPHTDEPGDPVRFTGELAQRGPWEPGDEPTAREFWEWALCQRPLFMDAGEYPAGGRDEKRYRLNYKIRTLPEWWPIEAEQ